MITRRTLLGLIGASVAAPIIGAPVAAAETLEEKLARLMARIQRDVAELNSLGVGEWELIRRPIAKKPWPYRWDDESQSIVRV